MLIVTKEKEIELKLKTRLMLLLEERLHIEDTQLFWQKAALAKFLRIARLSSRFSTFSSYTSKLAM